ncbi:MAG: hypothetical protein A3E01_03880 [Gammaproteobacteria bacterium RIFCSPHIGHO2_12_FULL_63_22]|nr:MAG: hypothetical protein A3E01_03880 [Gammaproteobacteria bacterium RIFCSPHIGHO2_12_FULL_63_22]
MNLLKKIACTAVLVLLGGVGSPVAVANSISASQLASAREAEQPHGDEMDPAVQPERPVRDGKPAARTRKPRETRAVERMGSRTGDTLDDLMNFNLPSQRL